jgi:uncharacterized membrane protein
MTLTNANRAPAAATDLDGRSRAGGASTSPALASSAQEGPIGSSTRHRTQRIPHPALVRQAEERARKLQNRIADAITSYAGSMRFVYVHIAVFAIWMIWLEKTPWPTLTLVVSLEAIFLSTFVMISQNRADEKRAALASEAWQSVQLEEKQNEELLQLSQQILGLTGEIHKLTVARAEGTPPTG